MCVSFMYLFFTPNGRGTRKGLSFVVRMSQGRQSQFYKTGAWVNCRDNYMRSVGGLCEKCKAKGLIVPAVIVHHKIHLSASNLDDPSVTLNPKNLEALCRQCHGEEHGAVKRFDILPDGTVVPRA